MADASVAVAVTADASNFINGMRAASGASESFLSRLGKGSAVFAQYTAAAATAGAGLIAAFYHSAAQAIDQQAKLARAVGSSVGSFQALAYAADLAGVNQEALAAASGKLNNKIGEAIQNGGESAATFQRLGLSVQQLANMDADQRFAAIADRIKELGVDSTIAGAALKEMGLKGEEMRQFIMDGGEQIRQASSDLEAYGVKLNDIDANKIEAANDAISQLGLISQGVGNSIATVLSPYIQAIATRLGDAAKGSHGFRDAIENAVKTGVIWAARMADAWRAVQVVFKGLQVAISAVAAGLVILGREIVTGVAKDLDFIVAMINKVIESINKVKGTAHELLTMPSQSNFITGWGEAAEWTKMQTKELAQELQALASQPMATDGIDAFFAEVKQQVDENTANAAQAANDRAKQNGVKKVGKSKAETDEDKKNKAEKDKSNQIVGNIYDDLKKETATLQSEYSRREDILKIHRENTLAADAPYYAQQLNDIKINELSKKNEIDKAIAARLAEQSQRRQQAIEQVHADESAIAAVKAQYSIMESQAKANQQQQITEIEEQASAARAKLREAEKQHAIGTALGLGQQLMSVTQGHSKKAFELSKSVSLASAVIDGYRSATAAWAAGMATGGPWAPAVAAAYTAASLLKTGALIQSIKSASFNGGGGAPSASAGGGGAITPAAAAGGGGSGAGGPQAGNVQRVSFAGDFFSGSAVEKIAKSLVQYQKDGGQVVFNS